MSTKKNGILDRESKTIEYKRELPSNQSSIIKTCVAFANTAGGKIIVGVEDGTLEIIGLNDKSVTHALEAIPAAVYQSVSPALIPDVYSQQINDKELVVVEVSRGNNPPYFVKAQGSKKGVYARVGPTTRVASEEHIEELFSFKNRKSFELETGVKSLESLDRKLLEEAFGRSPSQNTLISEKVVISTPGKVLLTTNAGLLAFGNKPEDQIPEAGIICSRFRGIEGRDIVETFEIDGPISDLVAKTLNFLSRHLEHTFKLNGSRLQGTKHSPEEALREAVVNAVVHRKYQIPTRCKIAVYDNRVEIFSPGGLPGLLTVNNLGDGSSHLRNPILAKFARRLRLVEKPGSGIRLMIDSCVKSGIVPPTFHEDGDFVKVVFSKEKIKTPTVTAEEVIKNLLKNLDVVRIRDVQKETIASRNTITNVLNKMIKEKKVKRFGKGAGVYYKNVTT